MPKLEKRRVRLVVDMLKASNRLERMSHDEIRVMLRQAASLLIQTGQGRSERRAGPVVTPSAGERPEPLPRYDPADAFYELPLEGPRKPFNWKLFLAMFAVGFVSLIAAVLLMG